MIKPDLYFLKDRILVLAKQEQNNATVSGFYVLVLFKEIRAASLCKYMKERKKTNQNAVCKYDVTAVSEVLSVQFYQCWSVNVFQHLMLMLFFVVVK